MFFYPIVVAQLSLHVLLILLRLLLGLQVLEPQKKALSPLHSYMRGSSSTSRDIVVLYLMVSLLSSSFYYLTWKATHQIVINLIKENNGYNNINHP
jgi:hypothetical protein